MPKPPVPHEDYDLWQCPECTYIGFAEEFDRVGACEDNVFCPQCGIEFDPVTQQPHEADPAICAGCRRRLEDANLGAFHPPNPSSLYLPKEDENL